MYRLYIVVVNIDKFPLLYPTDVIHSFFLTFFEVLVVKKIS
jgi:hypothetical protein